MHIRKYSYRWAACRRLHRTTATRATRGVTYGRGQANRRAAPRAVVAHEDVGFHHSSFRRSPTWTASDIPNASTLHTHVRARFQFDSAGICTDAQTGERIAIARGCLDDAEDYRRALRGGCV